MEPEDPKSNSSIKYWAFTQNSKKRLDSAITEAMEAHFFAQESSSTHRFQVRQHELKSCGVELKICESNLIPVQKSEPLWFP